MGAQLLPWPVSDRHKQLMGLTEDFVRECVLPSADSADESGAFPAGVQEAFHQTGIAHDFVEPRPGDEFATRAALVAESLAYGCAAYASFLMLPVFFNRVIVGSLPPAEAEEFKLECQRRPVVTSFAATERASGSDLLAMAVSAERDDGGYRISGRKEYSSNLGQADFVAVVARTGAEERSRNAHTWFLVPTDAPGVKVGPRWPTFGLRALHINPLDLDGVHVPEARRLGGEGEGISLMAKYLNESRTGIAALGVGIARRARDLVIDHSRRRIVFGEKLSKQQDYRFRIAEMERDIAAARALIWAATVRMEAGEDSTREASLAKWFSGEMVMRVTTAASAMLGSVGYTLQTPVEKLIRDGRHVAIVEGSDPIHKEIIFAHVLRHGGY
jgi:alkylation response protein AidB-like acyl-CoA dehydrogenase